MFKEHYSKDFCYFLEVMLDTDSFLNIINQGVIIEHQLQSLKDAQLSCLKILNKKKVYCYKVYYIYM